MLVGSAATRMVAARSEALMPVVTPKRGAASMLTVNAVRMASVLSSLMSGSSSSAQRSGVSARQIIPFASSRKLTLSGVTNSAAHTRSPSFSRSSSSATTMHLPARRSASACSMVPNAMGSPGPNAG